MPNSCAVLGCKNRQSKTLRLYRFPAICKKPKFTELSLIRRNRWLTALQRDDINEKNARVCAIHFISGASASLKDMYNPDWVPSLNMGNPLYPKRRKYSNNAERKEHAFADLFELIGDGETNNDTSANDNKEKSDEENEQSQDHNYSRNLFLENISEYSDNYEDNLSESVNSSRETDYHDASADRFIETDIQIYHEPKQNLIKLTNIDIDMVSCDNINKFKNSYHIAEKDVKHEINSDIEQFEKINRFNNMNEHYFNQPDQDTKEINIYHSDQVDNCSSNDKFNQTIISNCYEPEQNLNGTIIYTSIHDVENCYTISQLDEKKPIADESTSIFWKTDEENRFNQIEEKTEIQEQNYSEMENEILDGNLHCSNNLNNKNSDNNSGLGEIIFYKPTASIYKEIGTQTYMSNNMFEYLVTEIAKKNLTIQQKSSIIAEKDKKIGKLKLQLHKLRLGIYNSEVNRKKQLFPNGS